MQISEVLGNSQLLDGGSMFGNAPKAVWSRWHSPDSQGRINLACRCMLVELNGLKILCETGIGSYMEPKLKERFGVQENHHVLLKSLGNRGIDHTEINFVILSHLHFDHAGGLLPDFTDLQKGQDDLLFPNATYVVGEEALSRSKSPHFRDRASFIPGLVEKLHESKRLFIVERDNPKSPDGLEDIQWFFSDGHTPGQMLAIFSYGGVKVIFLGDLIPGQSWVHLPITMGYDRYPELLIDEKAGLYEMLKGQNWFGFFTHDPNIAAAKILQSSNGRFEPHDVKKSMRRYEFN